MPKAPASSAFNDTTWHFARLDSREQRSADERRTYGVQIGVPVAPAPARGYPAVVILDGHLVAALFDARLPQAGEPVIAVLIGHAPMGEGAREARAFDFTPPIVDRDPLADPRNPDWRNGGADAFLALLTEVILPDILARYAVDPARLTLFGHSYGALCVLHAVRSQMAGQFGRLVAVSPSVWWQDGAICAGLPPAHAHPCEMLIMAGTDEAWHAESVGPDGSPASRAGGTPTLPAARALAQRLAAQPDIAVACHAIQGGTHRSMLAQSIAPALDFARYGRAAIATVFPPDTDLLETLS